MAVSFRYWDECVDPKDLEAMWQDPEVRAEWLEVGEVRGRKVHLSRDPDGQTYLTQVEMRAVADITVRRHFDYKIHPDMLRALAELMSNRQPLAMEYDKKTKQTTLGIMQISQQTAVWLFREMGFRAYNVEQDPNVLFRPFVSVYFGAAYLKCLFNFEHIERTEEFVVTAYYGDVKKATHKSTLQYWKRYLSVKESFPPRKFGGPPTKMDSPAQLASHATAAPCSESAEGQLLFWDSKTSPEDMIAMWDNPEVAKEWVKTGEKKGQVRFSLDNDNRPYLSREEVKAVAEIVLTKQFGSKKVTAAVLCAVAEVVGMRFVNGVGPRIGLMGIDYSTAFWLYKDIGYRAYKVDSVDDLTKPFVSMYFGAAYLQWLSEYDGRHQTPKFVLQAYIAGPKNVNLQETGPLWLKFEEAFKIYEDVKKDSGSCTIL